MKTRIAIAWLLMGCGGGAFQAGQNQAGSGQGGGNTGGFDEGGGGVTTTTTSAGGGGAGAASSGGGGAGAGPDGGGGSGGQCTPSTDTCADLGLHCGVLDLGCGQSEDCGAYARNELVDNDHVPPNTGTCPADHPYGWWCASAPGVDGIAPPKGCIENPSEPVNGWCCATL